MIEDSKTGLAAAAGRSLLSFHSDGTVTANPDMKPDDAARAIISLLVKEGWLRYAPSAIEATGKWRVVPVEPTEEMFAAVDCAGEKRDWPSGRAWKEGWSAMLRAAPKVNA